MFHPPLQKIPTGDPDCPEEVKLEEQIKRLIRNKAALGDTEEEFNLKKVEFGEREQTHAQVLNPLATVLKKHSRPIFHPKEGKSPLDTR